MNYERSHSGDRTSSKPKNSIIAKPRNRIKYTESRASLPTVDQSSNNHQIILFHKILWFWLQQSSWFNLGRGFFWGIVVGLTAMISATFGVVITKVDLVEQTIARTIDRHKPPVASEASKVPNLTRQINILAIEVEPSDNQAIESSQTFVGESKTILLLKFQPNSKRFQVINIPIDSRVKIPEFGWGTLADANRYGGTTLVSESVAQLLDGITIERYVHSTPQTFQKLLASGKIKLNSCDLISENCDHKSQQVWRQQIATETIRQRLNVPGYLSSFENSLIELQADLDTNLSLREVMAIANFVKDLESEKIVVNQLTQSSQLLVPHLSRVENKSTVDRTSILPRTKTAEMFDATEDISIAVQNTTENPELGMRLVAYLRSQNFQDVYLVEHIPLRLDKTRIIINQSQIATAKHLKNILGLGGLEQKLSTIAQPLTIQIGEDAGDLLLNNSIGQPLK